MRCGFVRSDFNGGGMGDRGQEKATTGVCAITHSGSRSLA